MIIPINHLNNKKREKDDELYYLYSMELEKNITTYRPTFEFLGIKFSWQAS